MDLLETLKAKGLINIQNVTIPKAGWLPIEVLSSPGYILGAQYKVRQGDHPVVTEAKKGYLAYYHHGGQVGVVIFQSSEFDKIPSKQIEEYWQKGYTPGVHWTRDFLATETEEGEYEPPQYAIHPDLEQAIFTYPPFHIGPEQLFAVCRNSQLKRHQYGHTINFNLRGILDAINPLGLGEVEANTMVRNNFGHEAFAIMQEGRDWAEAKIAVGGGVLVSKHKRTATRVFGSLLDGLELESTIGILEGYVITIYLNGVPNAEPSFQLRTNEGQIPRAEIGISPIVAIPASQYAQSLNLRAQELKALYKTIENDGREKMQQIAPEEWILKSNTKFRTGSSFIMKAFHRAVAPSRWDRIVFPALDLKAFQTFSSPSISALGDDTFNRAIQKIAMENDIEFLGKKQPPTGTLFMAERRKLKQYEVNEDGERIEDAIADFAEAFIDEGPGEEVPLIETPDVVILGHALRREPGTIYPTHEVVFSQPNTEGSIMARATGDLIHVEDRTYDMRRTRDRVVFDVTYRGLRRQVEHFQRDERRARQRPEIRIDHDGIRQNYATFTFEPTRFRDTHTDTYTGWTEWTETIGTTDNG